MNRTLFCCLLLAVPALLSGELRAASSHYASATTEQLVAESEFIVSGVIESARSRWSSSARVVVTDFKIGVTEVFQGDLDASGELRVTQGGGSLEGWTMAVSSNPSLQVGQRYLMFISRSRGEVFSPFVGGGQGVAKFLPDGRLLRLSDGSILSHSDIAASIASARKNNLVDPPEVYGAHPQGHSGIADLLHEGAQELGAGSPSLPSLIDAHPRSFSFQPEDLAAGSGMATIGSGRYQYFGWVVPPVVWNGWPNQAPFAGVDVEMMQQWNQYSHGLHVPIANPTGVWIWGNGIFDLAGFPDNATMISQVGEGWAPGVLGVCFTRRHSGGRILEADIALNPYFNWTTSEFHAASSSSPLHGVRQTLLHELGHAIGIDHPWEHYAVGHDSVMNYAPKSWRYPILHLDDRMAVDDRYPRGALGSDMAIKLYTVTNVGSNHAWYSSSIPFSLQVDHWQSFSIGAFSIENLGTQASSESQLSLWLSQEWRGVGGADYMLQSYSLGSVAAGGFMELLLADSFSIQPNVLPGKYFPTLQLSMAGDQNLANNTAAAAPEVFVEVSNFPPLQRTIGANGWWSLDPQREVGPGGTWRYRLRTPSGKMVEVSLCPDQGGGWSDFETRVHVSGAHVDREFCAGGELVTFFDEHPGGGNGNVDVLISAEGRSRGLFRVAFRGSLLDARIFSGNFE